MWNPHFSIRTTLLAIIGALNVLIAVLVGSQVYESWVRYSEVKILRQNAEVTSMFYKAARYLSLERGVASSILYATQGTIDDFLPQLAQHRKAADSYLDRGIERLEKSGIAENGLIVQQVMEYRENLQDVRTELDKAATMPASSHDALLAEHYFEAVTALTTEVGSLIESYSLPVMDTDAKVSQQMRFKHIVWEITEYGGREYAVIGTLIATNKLPSPDIQTKLRNWRGHIEYGWELARSMAREIGVNQELYMIIEEAETHYFMAFDQIKDIFYSSNIDDFEGPYPISIELWLELASQAVDSLLAMKDAVLEQSLEYINMMEGDAARNIALSLLLFICALALSLYSCMVVIFRVVRPVNTMVDALYKAIHGEPYQIRSARYSYDEIGKLGHVLEAFQKNSNEMEDQKNYLQTVLGTIMDAIFTIDSKGTIRVVNRAAEKMFGYAAPEMIGHNIDLLMPGQFPPQTGSEKELLARHKDGTVFPVETAIAEMRRAGGREFVGVIRDITQRKAADERIKQYLSELEKSNQELDDFAYIASHDLKEPLRGLHNFSGFLIEDYDDKLDNEGKEMLHMIGDLTQRMEGLLNSLLHYSRLGRTELSIQNTDLNDLVKSVITMFSITIREKGAEVKIVNDLPVIVCDHVRIKEVFQNLIGNALKYNDMDRPVVEIGSRGSGQEAALYVKDNGIGIEKKDLGSIFKIFRRLHAQNAYGGGTGSGLTIAKKIVNQHGGEIWAESEGPGKGTTFFFTIPDRVRGKQAES